MRLPDDMEIFIPTGGVDAGSVGNAIGEAMDNGQADPASFGNADGMGNETGTSGSDGGDGGD